MGMKVDETIIQAKLLKDGVGKDTYKYEILTSLIDIAKKYQKIEQIYRMFNEVNDFPEIKAYTKDEVIDMLKKLRDMCRSYRHCYDGCPLDDDKGDCVMIKPPYIWSDEDVEKITQLERRRQWNT